MNVMIALWPWPSSAGLHSRVGIWLTPWHIDSSRIGSGMCRDICDMLFCLMAFLTFTVFLSLPVAHWPCIQVRPSNTRQHCHTHLVPWWQILLPAHDTWLRLEFAYSSRQKRCGSHAVVPGRFCRWGLISSPTRRLVFLADSQKPKRPVDLCERLLEQRLWAFWMFDRCTPWSNRNFQTSIAGLSRVQKWIAVGMD